MMSNWGWGGLRGNLKTLMKGEGHWCWDYLEHCMSKRALRHVFARRERYKFKSECELLESGPSQEHIFT